ncbi:MAG: rhomboid family intramembrane serine protease [Flavobacteriia bacterium]|nr:rhomboid family intramembrane serine protease [Flavobacteriia bacterium]OIP47292.1 MAG: rhomboid family intramembrane serine protease [Flavobacteriaceae bacterium CG2_30_31_66]PIV96126.1 MAG: rhomboid family intramembrane serine protease [Flavobacteriaceae bacterium CG17_big_fil_post_rev_8_21_14_2_50_31_13]PIX13052.1 MAG: rhomboid family intramembrane serine protease [Flavobacteriaceae bacterium CG_4_8_14_3_um_filter_31_8]PIY14343.1 MAG: rhomboid family intramembrane serine protease [Flavoba
MLQNTNIIVFAIIIVNVIVSMKGFDNFSFFESYKFQVNKITKNEKMRLLSSGFLHVDWMHLGFNMYALYLFGGIVSSMLGIFSFLTIYFGSLIAGNLYTLHYHKNEPYYSAVGASGAVSGIVYSSILLFPNMKLLLFFAIPMPGYVFGVGYLLYSIYGMKKQLGNIGHAAHLGGTISGFAITLLFVPTLFLTNTIFVILLAIPIVLLLLFGSKLKSL